MAEIQTILNRFDAGMVNDKRTPLSNACRVVSNFDILTTPYKLLPYRDNESGDDAGSTSKKQNFAIGTGASGAGTSYQLYALGVASGTNNPEVLFKDLDTVGSGDLSEDTWQNTLNNQGNGTLQSNLFVFYEKTGKFYGTQTGTSRIWSYDPSGPTWADAAHSPTFTAADVNTNGLVHSKDDILYVPIGNVIYKNDDDSWSTGITLPANLKIMSITEYGNFLAIGCASKSGEGDSVIYLWNRDDSLETLTESIKTTRGDLKVLDVVDGLLIAITTRISGNDFTKKIVFSAYTNKPEMETIMELVADKNTTPSVLTKKQHANKRVYFQMEITLDGTVYAGVWSFGRSATDQSFALAHERYIATDYSAAQDEPVAFLFAADYLFQSYTDNGTYKVVKTNNTETQTVAAVYETVINPGMDIDDRQREKRLSQIALKTEPLDSNGQIVVKYKVDNDSSWTTIMTHDTENAVVKEHAKAFKIGRDFQFRLESTGGAVITSFKANYDKIKTQIQ